MACINLAQAVSSRSAPIGRDLLLEFRENYMLQNKESGYTDRYINIDQFISAGRFGESPCQLPIHYLLIQLPDMLLRNGIKLKQRIKIFVTTRMIFCS